MPDRRRPPVLLFVAGEPVRGDPFSDVAPSMTRRMLGFVVGGLAYGPGWRWQSGRTAPSGVEYDLAWQLPRDQVVAMNVALDVVEERGLGLIVVDVNRPEDLRELLDRWVREDDVFPEMIRPDGERLAGVEEFTPPRLREFLRSVPR